MKMCKQCGTEFDPNGTTRVYCNIKCKREYINNKKRKGFTERLCIICNQPFMPVAGCQKYCLICRKDVRKKQAKKNSDKWLKANPLKRKKVRRNYYLKKPYGSLTREEKDAENERKRKTYWKDPKLARVKTKKNMINGFQLHMEKH